jgi:hypothetical protein
VSRAVGIPVVHGGEEVNKPPSEPPYIILRRLHALSSSIGSAEAEVYDETPLTLKLAERQVRRLRIAAELDIPKWWYFSQRIDRVPVKLLLYPWKQSWDIRGWWNAVGDA